jgi:hypothetical protein
MICITYSLLCCHTRKFADISVQNLLMVVYNIDTMMKTEIQELIFPFGQPEDILRLVEQRVAASAGQYRLPAGAVRVLILDARPDRAGYVAQFLLLKGHAVQIAASGMEAFTLFLRGVVAPLLILTTQEPLPDHFFLQRLAQQMRQKYSCEPLLVRLPAGLIDLLVPHITQPLSPATRTSSQTTDALSFGQRITGQQAGGAKQHRTAEKKISLTGQNLGRYQINDLIGDGPWGAVYLAYDRLRERDVALKAVQTDAFAYFSQEESLFQHEEKLLGQVKHPHILPLFTCGKSYVSGSPFIYKTMLHCPVGSLADWLTAHVSLQSYQPTDVLAVILPLAEALELAHEQQITHNNLKLTNLLISGETETLAGMRLLLADFLPDQENRFLARTPENFPFLAPEQWQGQSFATSDQYALAVLTYRLLAGRFPFLGETEQLLRQMHLTAQPQPLNRFNPAVSAALNAVVLSALAKKPHERFRSIAEFARALQFAVG